MVNASIRKAAALARQMYPEIPYILNDPILLTVAQMLNMELDQMHPLLMDDDVEHHITVLSSVKQDETEDPLVRQVAIMRQQQFWMWLSQKQASVEGSPEEEQKPQAGGQMQASPFTPATQEAFNPTQPAGGVNAASMQQADQAFNQRTA